jgi:lipopolysaccharide/colanic/teichoic acid biosynthesis glycosyltransferase
MKEDVLIVTERSRFRSSEKYERKNSNNDTKVLFLPHTLYKPDLPICDYSLHVTQDKAFVVKFLNNLLKRSFDISASLFGLIILSPLFFIISLLIKLRMGGPVFFRQQRAGRHGKPFTMCKFRTMELNHNGCTVSVLGENRITPLGAVLRKYKLDELPELWIVLMGDMSFVGPRPDMVEYAEKLEGEERLILEMRPGITGPATLKYANEEVLLASVTDPVKYNSDVIWPDKVRINLEYLRKSSFAGDITIILRTIFGNRKQMQNENLNKSVVVYPA